MNDFTIMKQLIIDSFNNDKVEWVNIMMIDKVIKWHDTKDLTLANEICEDLYELYMEMYNNNIFNEEEHDKATKEQQD